MKTPSVEGVIKLGKVVGEVCLAAIAYGTINMNPRLVHRAVALATVGSVFSCVWVMGSTKAAFRKASLLLRRPLLPLTLAFVFYGALHFVIDYLDYHAPQETVGTLADLLIQLLFALTFSFLAISVCSLLRDLGIDPADYLQKLKTKESNGNSES